MLNLREKAAFQVFFIIAVILLSGRSGIMAQIVQDDPEKLRDIDVEEHLNEFIPLDLEYTADDGSPVKLKEYFIDDRPVILILGYYSCPMLCNLIMNGFSEGVRQLAWLPGKEFQVVSVSIDPSETELLASAKKANYIKVIGKPGIDKGWDFLTGPEDRSRALAEAVGFKYYFDEDQDMYAHPAVLVVLTGDGRISRYLYGIEYKERDLRLALVEASEGRIGSTLDKIILYCFHYDPDAGSYVIFAENIMRLGGAITLILLAILLISLWLKERHKRRKASVSEGSNPG